MGEPGVFIRRAQVHDPMTTPLAFDAHRMRPAFGKAARIKGDDAIGLAQSTGHLRHQHLDQRAMIPWCDADEFLYDLSLDIDEGGDVLGIFPGQVRQESLEIEVHVALSDLSLQRLSIGYDELGQTVDHGVEDIGETIQSLNNSSRRCAHVSAIFSPPGFALPMVGADREAIVFTTRYVMQWGAKAEHTVGIR